MKEARTLHEWENRIDGSILFMCVSFYFLCLCPSIDARAANARARATPRGRHPGQLRLPLEGFSHSWLFVSHSWLFVGRMKEARTLHEWENRIDGSILFMCVSFIFCVCFLLLMHQLRTLALAPPRAAGTLDNSAFHWKVIRSPPLLDHIPLYSPLNGGV